MTISWDDDSRYMEENKCSKPPSSNGTIVGQSTETIHFLVPMGYLKMDGLFHGKSQSNMDESIIVDGGFQLVMGVPKHVAGWFISGKIHL